jgi:site-specific recombinase XerD
MKLSYLDNSPPYLKEYLNYMSTIKGRAENTVKSYYEDIKLFFRFLKKKKRLISADVSFEDIKVADFPEELVKLVTIADVMEFLHFMSRERNNNQNARMRRAIALRQFYKYLTVTKGWFVVSPIERLELPKSKHVLPKHLTVLQAETLLDNLDRGKNDKPVQSAETAEISEENNAAADTADTQEVPENESGEQQELPPELIKPAEISKIVPETWRNVRDFCIITLFLNCGMRLSELVGINIHDCKAERDSETGEMMRYIKVMGKGSKERVIYLNKACIDAYDIWYNVRMKVAEEVKRLRYENALFISTRYQRIANRTVQQITTDALKQSQLDGMGFSVHKLRHTAATLMYQNGVDVRVLKDVLGHVNLNTTQIYTHVANRQLRQAIKHNPLSKEDSELEENYEEEK